MPKHPKRSVTHEARFRAANASPIATQRLADMRAAAETSPTSTGRRNALAHVSGKPLTASAAISVKCWDCCGHYVDGRDDCQVPWCPLYAWMPYGTMRKATTKRKEAEAHEQSH
jgi:hypothetical protein